MFSFFLLVTTASAAAITPAADGGLNAPFATPRPQTVAAATGCPSPPPPLTALDTVNMYRADDPTFSHADPMRVAARDTVTAPVKAFTAGISRLANNYVASNGRDVRSGACALQWLATWAKAGAMLQMKSHDAQFLRSVHLSGWAMDFAQVRGLRIVSDDPRPQIRTWLAQMAGDMRRHYDSLSNTTARNNHRYWAGFAAMAVAMDNGDRNLAGWALTAARIGIDQITPMGALPLEVGRRSKARLYHVYGAEPLVMTAEIAAANGNDLYGYRGGALHRLVSFALSSITVPARMAALAGVPQDPWVNPRGAFDTQTVAWTEFYARRFPGRLPYAPTIASHRPLVNPEIGGDMTMLSGVQGRQPAQ